MQKKFILLPLIVTLLYVLLTSYSEGPASFAGLDRTGASGAAGCGGSGCHTTASVSTPTTSISIQLLSSGTPVTSYTGGAAYTIRITGTQTSAAFTLPDFGFQVSVVNSGTTTNAGTLSAIAGTHTATASGINIVEHSSALAATTGTGGSGTTYVVNIPWTAPVAGTGSVKIFSALNAVNDDGSASSADKWNNTSLVITETTVAGVDPITGTMSVCTGSATLLADATTGGTWSSSPASVATVVPGTGNVSGVSPGTATITYTAAGGSVTAVVTVNALPGTIGGVGTMCQGSALSLTDGTSGGTWASANTAIATVLAATGGVTGVSPGTSMITYTLPTGCSASAIVTVNTGSIAPVTGTTNICVSTTTTLADATTGGTWSSSTTGVATVSSAGLISGIAGGTSIITYTVGSGCRDTALITVHTLGGTISGGSVVCIGSTITLTENETGGTWISATPTLATAGATTGVVGGVALGTDTIKYTVTNVCGTGTAKHAVAVHAAGTCASGVAAFTSFGISELKVYPNPARNGMITVNLTSDMDAEAQLLITNVMGSRVKELTIQTNGNNELNLQLPAGIYFLNAITEHERYTVKLLLQ